MNEREFQPEEFARLLALPQDDPERVRAERSSRFVAWKHMLEAFESPVDELLAAPERARAEAALAERVQRAMTHVGTAEPSPRRSALTKASWLERWMAGNRWAALRPALAVAAAIVVVGVGWWSIGHFNQPAAVRSAGESVVALRSTSVSQGVELRWSAVPETRFYRLTFFGPDLTERARIDSLLDTDFVLRAASLPAGLSRGQPVMVEVTAVRRADVVRSRPVSIQLP